MFKSQVKVAIERLFDVSLTRLAERHPFNYVGLNESGHVDVFILYVDSKESFILLDVDTLAHAHGLSGATLKHCVLVAHYDDRLHYEYFDNLIEARHPILPKHPLGLLTPVMCVGVESLQGVPA